MSKSEMKLGFKSLIVKYHGRDVGILAISNNRKVAFFYNEEEKMWCLSPAYDLTYSNTDYGEHTTSVDGNGKNPGEKEILNVGIRAGIKKQHCIDIMDEIKQIVVIDLGKYNL